MSSTLFWWDFFWEKSRYYKKNDISKASYIVLNETPYFCCFFCSINMNCNGNYLSGNCGYHGVFCVRALNMFWAATVLWPCKLSVRVPKYSDILSNDGVTNPLLSRPLQLNCSRTLVTLLVFANEAACVSFPTVCSLSNVVTSRLESQCNM